ncbi:hypothetical protein EGW08_020632 [Elysia chlorotica]|uniref:CCHC-type domain-containing protein n=1 Tax=Elysia chlorotica TaxID=188477 RepID=A0A433SQU3_ELYCH|nr:hypothetical protein EGW08_020632 [Elysia chlorotica]
MATRNATELNSTSNGTTAVHAVKKVHTPKKNFHATKNAKFPPCNSCGKTSHRRSDCFYRDAECNICHKNGHIQKVCKSTSHSSSLPGSKHYQPKNPHHTKRVHQVDNDRQETEADFEDFFSIHQCGTKFSKIWVHPLINNNQVKMELDTGSSLSLMTLNDYQSILKESPKLIKGKFLELKVLYKGLNPQFSPFNFKTPLGPKP